MSGYSYVGACVCVCMYVCVNSRKHIYMCTNNVFDCRCVMCV